MAAERRRVLAGGALRDTLCLARLHKRYGSDPATKVRLHSLQAAEWGTVRAAAQYISVRITRPSGLQSYCVASEMSADNPCSTDDVEILHL